MFSDPALLCSRLLFIGLIVEAFEMIKLSGAFSDNGIWSRSNLAILTTGCPWQVRAGATFGGNTAVVLAMIVQMLSAVIVLATGLQIRAGICSALLCLFANGYLRTRRQIGGSGAEQLTFIVLVTFALVMLAGGTKPARRIGDAFVAGQVLLAYFVSGASKAASAIWRRGEAMRRILSTEGYGAPFLSKLMTEHAWLDKLVCWSVIAWETAFPVVLFVPKPLIIALFCIGIVFHLACAVMMGLNRFVWAFCGCYPAVWTTAMLLK